MCVYFIYKQIPESVMDKKAREYNKGRVFIHGASESTANAYKRQFQTDWANFLKCRSLEIKKGGSMFLLDRKSTRLNSSHSGESRMPSSA